MRTYLLLLTFLMFFLQVKSQDSEIEIYLMQNNSIVKGKLLESSKDSIRVMVDSLNTLAFAKSELEGKELPVSKEVKKFRKKLIRNEAINAMSLYPGIYQIRNGKKTIGKIMFGLSTLGIMGTIASGVVFAVVLTSVPGLYGALAALGYSLIGLSSSAVLWTAGFGWSMTNTSMKITNKVKNRYYFSGEIPATTFVQ